MDYKPILPLVLIFALLSQFSITIIDAKKALPDVPPASATTRGSVVQNSILFQV